MNEISERIAFARIARAIRKDWKKVSVYAEPYLKAMERDDYGLDGTYSVVLRFLSNASGYRGELARTLKAELKSITVSK
jgi:hypothetical protein